ncbi:uncharacterized protein LOC117169656 [Belonocnema kinseyi]|uniref:uncharacterized protein LOC117169656 n=1 Tax=Belonocnema kinseyi TaxID=2817044 RepID=UPI00143DD3FC|nr:uncharacterized protein LOC117169656 [Belonocnema kinseyi]
MIGLWLDSTQAIVLKADFEGNYAPSGTLYFDSHNFLIRLLYLDGLKVVGYINQDGTLLGVRAPKPNAGSRIVEPNESTWYISYSAKKFKIKINPATENVLGITLMPRNVHEAEHTPEKVLIGGIRFFVFRGPSGDILGAALHQ